MYAVRPENRQLIAGARPGYNTASSLLARVGTALFFFVLTEGMPGLSLSCQSGFPIL